MLVRIISKENKKGVHLIPSPSPSIHLSILPQDSSSINFDLVIQSFSQLVSQPAIYITLPGRYILLRYQTPTLGTLPYLPYVHKIHT